MKVNGQSYRTIWFESNCLKLIYQPLLPHQFEIRTLNTSQEVIQAIREMWVRGAPAIGAAGAFGMVLTVLESTEAHYREYSKSGADLLRATRPTAKNLFVGIDRVFHQIQKDSIYSTLSNHIILIIQLK